MSKGMRLGAKLLAAGRRPVMAQRRWVAGQAVQRSLAAKRAKQCAARAEKQRGFCPYYCK